MADEEQEDRTEDPTPRRLEEAREEGRIAHSVELTAGVSVCAAIVLLKLFGPAIADSWLALTRMLAEDMPLTSATLWTDSLRVIAIGGGAIGPFLAALLFLVIVGGLSQSGLLLVWKKLQPDASRLNPLSGFQRIFSLEGLQRLAISLLKLLLLCWIAYASVPRAAEQLLSTSELPAALGFALGMELLYRLSLNLAVALLLLGVLDYAIQRWKLMRSLRMTKQEVREEMKRMEGDPQLKQRRKQIQMKLAMQRAAQEVPKADVVVTNPTEYAVALRYDDGNMGAPRVVAKGTDRLALRIREIAAKHGVPIVQRPPLARALYAACEVGEEIPGPLYKAVAEVLAYVYQISGKVRKPADQTSEGRATRKRNPRGRARV